MGESAFKEKLRDKIEKKCPGSVILITDPTFFQGIPDWVILYENMWAVLEIKKSKTAHRQPNQEYYINLLGKMSFAAVVYPENMEDVVAQLQNAFGLSR